VEIEKYDDPDTSYIKIDGVDIMDMGLHELRGNISIIPQMPFILTGTVRYNVDPQGKATDDEIWRTLEDVQLKDHVERLPQQLDTPMTAATSVFSVGQKQLVCLGRSILKPANIMIMDEATASMDLETDNYVTNKIRNVFNHSTTFTIAHRLSTIANYDKVLVLDKGQIKEFAEPYRLLVKNIGDDSLTNEAGHFTSMVNNTGPITSKHIFQIAMNAYYERHPDAQKPKGGIPQEGSDNEAGLNADDSIAKLKTSSSTGSSEMNGRQDQERSDIEKEKEKRAIQQFVVPEKQIEVLLDNSDEGNVNDISLDARKNVGNYDFHTGAVNKF